MANLPPYLINTTSSEYFVDLSTPQNINPIDFYPNTAVGVNLAFTVQGVFQSTYTTQEAIRNNLINYFLTEPGERPLNPTFGGGLRSFLFEQIVDGNLEFLKDKFQEEIKIEFPSVKIENLDILKKTDNNEITVTMTYSIIGTPGTQQITYNFQ